MERAGWHGGRQASATSTTQPTATTMSLTEASMANNSSFSSHHRPAKRPSRSNENIEANLTKCNTSSFSLVPRRFQPQSNVHDYANKKDAYTTKNLCDFCKSQLTLKEQRLTVNLVADKIGRQFNQLNYSVDCSKSNSTGEIDGQLANELNKSASKGKFFVDKAASNSKSYDDNLNSNKWQLAECNLNRACGVAYASGENERCNCSGRRRSTLAGLIELFEQRQLVETNLKQLETDNNHNKREKRRRRHREMRNIITPVKYEPSDESGTTSELASHESASTASSAASTLPEASREHPASGRPSVRKLTAPNWQKPTDGRQYEHQLLSRGQQARSKQTSCKSVSKLHTQINNSSDLLNSVNQHQKSEVRRATSEPNCCRFINQRPVSICLGSRGPPIVKHQASSSRRLLRQLARLRRLNQPIYQVRRPERGDQVEALIEQLERLTSELDEDEHLFERAERRDLLNACSFGGSRKSPEAQIASNQTEEAELDDKSLDFGCRDQIDSLETAAIDRAHEQRYSATCGCGRGTPSSNFQSDVDRRVYDDLALRRLRLAESRAGSPVRVTPQSSYLLCAPAFYTMTTNQMDASYFYKPINKIGWYRENYDRDQSDLARVKSTSQLLVDQQIEHRVQLDDLHYRSLQRRNRPNPQEPPFGVPRDPVAHRSGSHLLQSGTTNSRVSFRGPGASSADSGLVLESPTGADWRSMSASPAPERHRTALSATPTRFRPRIRIESPRSRSPLLSAPNRDACKSSVQLQCYEDVWTRHLNSRSTSELECRLDFTDDDDDDDGLDPKVNRPASSASTRRIITTKLESSSSSSLENSALSSAESQRFDETLTTMQSPVNNFVNSTNNTSKNTLNKPFFTIGQYKPLNKPNLKIL